MAKKTTSRKATRRKPAKKRFGLPAMGRRARTSVAAGVAILALFAAGWFVVPFWRLSEQFGEHAVRQPTRLYGRPSVLAMGTRLSFATVLEELKAIGYHPTEAQVPGTGEYRRAGEEVLIGLRPTPKPSGWTGETELRIEIRQGRIAGLRLGDREVEKAELDRPLLASYYDEGRLERRPVSVEQLPEELLKAVLAAEDARFYRHSGLSLRGIGRAAWVNLRGADVMQGGSTLTQQLVKNLYLTHERTLARKLREVPLALILDARYEKDEILEAYLNEIYWGVKDGVNLMGVGAAAWAYFGKRPQELNLCESAVLAGMIRSPGNYAPNTNPENARKRRDWVLGRMAELEWIEGAEAAAVQAASLCADPHPMGATSTAYFADAMAEEAARRFGVDDVRTGGYSLLSTIGRTDQARAEEAVEWGTEALEKGWEKGNKPAGALQAALVSIDPRNGEILAYVGGRNYGASQFDRIGSARRQAGSAFKPIVYATAFESRMATPLSVIEDEPLEIRLANSTWAPQNSDRTFRGWVTARTALEQSLNVPTARLALAVGLEPVIETARRLGIEGRLEPLPSLALGAFEVSPLDLVSAYATFAAGGLRPSPHGLRAVLDPGGIPMAGDRFPKPERAISAEVAFLINSILRGVLDRGTGRSVRTQGVTDPLAGKTGTTNDGRDSWFVGYSPDRATLVWVGYDDNRASKLSGSRAALPIWGRFTWAVRPVAGYSRFPHPARVTTASVDPITGALAGDLCPEIMTEVFIRGTEPTRLCSLHGRWLDEFPIADTVEMPPEPEPGQRVEPPQREVVKKERWRWLKKVFGRKRRPN